MNTMLNSGVRAAEGGTLSAAGFRSRAVGSLRTTLTLLVVAHHAALAYHPYAPAPAASLDAPQAAWPLFPIVDPQRWGRADLFTLFNDLFFMSLMFFVAGVVAWPSLVRRGAGGFARERMLRLGAPFLVSALVLAPLAYYASYVATGADPSPIAFARVWLALGFHPAGPAWFLWVLLAFGLGAALLSTMAPHWGDALGRVTARLSQRPSLYAVALIAISAVVYVPMALAFTGERWTMIGPFAFQTSRLLHYAVYFLAGIGVGAAGLHAGLLAEDGPLARRWGRWTQAAFGAFGLAIVTLVIILSTLSKGGPGTALLIAGHVMFAVTCAMSSLAFVAIFARFGGRGEPSAWWESLGVNAYGVYLFHYVAVTWLQLTLLRAGWGGFAKTLAVFTAATAICWLVTATLRRLPGVARVL